jgi:hypothetical protein
MNRVTNVVKPGFAANTCAQGAHHESERRVQSSIFREIRIRRARNRDPLPAGPL